MLPLIRIRERTITTGTPWTEEELEAMVRVLPRDPPKFEYSPEGKERQGESTRERSLRRWQDPEYRARQSEAVREQNLRQWQDPEYRARMSEAMRSPEYRARQSEATRASWAAKKAASLKQACSASDETAQIVKPN